jgi:hypothetical protein
VLIRRRRALGRGRRIVACVGAAEPGVLRSAVVAFIGEWWASPEWRLVRRRRSRMRRVLDRMVVEGSTVARE